MTSHPHTNERMSSQQEQEQEQEQQHQQQHEQCCQREQHRPRCERQRRIARFPSNTNLLEEIYSISCDYHPKDKIAYWGSPNELYLQRIALKRDIKVLNQQQQQQNQQQEMEEPPKEEEQPQPQPPRRRMSDNTTFSSLGLWDKTHQGKQYKSLIREQGLEAVRNEIFLQWEMFLLEQQQEEEQEGKGDDDNDNNDEPEEEKEEEDDDDDEEQVNKKKNSSSFSSSSSSFRLQNDRIATVYQKVTYEAQQKAYKDALQLQQDIVNCIG